MYTVNLQTPIQLDARLFRVAALLVLVFTACLYAPVLDGQFIWDDWVSFKDLQGTQWLHYVFRDFNSWTMYFRPLVVALLALQVKLFNGTPGPMHAVSLGLHLLNTVLVGTLTYRISVVTGASRTRARGMTLVGMLLFAFHPALVEPVAWIGCQFDLITTLLTLSGLIVNVVLSRALPRAAILSVIFLLAACAKEAGAVFPMLIVLFDVALFARGMDRSLYGIVCALLRRNTAAYAGMILAAFAYLALRHWALDAHGTSMVLGGANGFAQFQKVCQTYLCYLKVIVWPMAGIGPLHPENDALFLTATPASLLSCVAAIGIVVGGLYLAIWRDRALGFIILAATIALLPVLRIVPVNLDHNLYHERYATLAIAMCCALLALVRWPGTTVSGNLTRVIGLMQTTAIIIWLVVSVVGIQALLPHWSDDIRLWRWAIDTHPASTVARDNLLLSFERQGRLAEAQVYSDELLADPTPCTTCMLHIARIAVEHGDANRAAAALMRASMSALVRQNKDSRQLYYRELGRLMLLEGHVAKARELLQTAVALDSKDPVAQRALASAGALPAPQEP